MDAVNELSRKVIALSGGTENILCAVSCMTRLRITVKDDALVRENDLKAAEGVLAVSQREAGYWEVVVGPGKSSRCMAVFRELGIRDGLQGEAPRSAEKGPAAASAADSAAVPAEAPAKAPKRRASDLTAVFGKIFAPLIPGIIVSGLCAGLAALTAQIVPGYADQPVLSVLFSLMTGINAAFMAYLPAWAGYRAAEVFGGTPILGGMVGMMTTLENINAVSRAAGLYNEAQPLESILRSGRGGLLAALIGVWLMCIAERAIRKRMPEALDTVFTPFLTLLCVLVPYVLLIMPAIGLVSAGLCRVIGFVAMNPNALVRMLAGYIGAAVFLPMVSLGMHHGLIALYSVQLETFGFVTLYPALAMAGAGQIGAALAIAVKAKRTGNHRLCRVINGAVPAAILGVGEPLIYGVTLPMGRPFLTAGLGAGFGGALVMLMQVASTTWGPSGVLGAFVMTEGPKGAVLSVCCYLAGLAVSCVLAYILTALLVKDSDAAKA